MSMKMGSLFAGIGGFDLGFERAGFAPHWQVEWDQHASKVLARHWPTVPRYGDIQEVTGHELQPAEVITFGSPCQDLSVAGRRAGLVDGERSNLFFEALRIFREMREATSGRYPTLVVWENVPGAFSSNGGADFAHVLAGLAELGAVDIAWRVLDAQYFGVAQRRRRVFVVADFGGERAGEVLFEREGVRRNPPSRGAAGEGIAGTIGGGSQSGGFRTTDLDNSGAFVVDDRNITSPGNRSNPQPGAPAPTQCDALRGLVRRLTPRECERLQGFPDDWTAGQADSHRYRQLGNAVAVLVAEWIGQRIAEASR